MDSVDAYNSLCSVSLLRSLVVILSLLSFIQLLWFKCREHGIGSTNIPLTDVFL